jgi:hypothetical protein
MTILALSVTLDCLSETPFVVTIFRVIVCLASFLATSSTTLGDHRQFPHVTSLH